MSEVDSEHVVDPDFGPLKLISTKVFEAQSGRPPVVERQWRGDGGAAPVGVLIVISCALSEIDERVRRDFRRICADPQWLLEEVATGAGYPAPDIEDLRYHGFTVAMDRIVAWMNVDPSYRIAFEVLIVDGVVTLIGSDP